MRISRYDRERDIPRFPWVRLLGLSGLTLAVGLLVFLLEKTDVSWLLPRSSARFQWPDLPFFSVQKDSSKDGSQETLYTVPTRQLTPGEVSQLGTTNQTTPVAPR